MWPCDPVRFIVPLIILALTACAGDLTGEQSSIPHVPECAELDASWPQEWADFEMEVLRLVNLAREESRRCGDETMAPAPHLVTDALLTCAARQHSMDFAEARELSHTGTDGRAPVARIQDIGYQGSLPIGENVAYGFNTPQSLVNEWLQSPGHCRNIMGSGYREIGIGYFNGQPAYPHACTQKFGAGRP